MECWNSGMEGQGLHSNLIFGMWLCVCVGGGGGVRC